MCGVHPNDPPAGTGRTTRRYDAILIDEGQDFLLSWLRSLTELLNPASDSLLFCHDPAQDIFGRKVTYKSLGIKVQGKRATELKRSYRNTVEILDLARRFSGVVEPRDEDSETPAESLLFPTAVRRHGPLPEFIVDLPLGAQFQHVLSSIGQLLERNDCGWQDIAVLHALPRHEVERFCATFAARFGPEHLYHVSADQGSKRLIDLAAPSVKLCTIESAKGMEFRVVYLLGLENMPRPNRDGASERSLVYVGLTRAQDALFLLGEQQKGFLQELSELASNRVPDEPGLLSV